jgi:hypothetical protein
VGVPDKDLQTRRTPVFVLRAAQSAVSILIL